MCALSVPAIALTRGTNGEEVLIPQLGLGTYKIPDDEAECVVRDALAVGYRHIDTAQMYGNEAGVGRAIAACGLPRRDLFVTSKLDNPNHRRDDALRSLDATMGALGLEVLDLFLVHWPLATSTGIDPSVFPAAHDGVAPASPRAPHCAYEGCDKPSYAECPRVGKRYCRQHVGPSPDPDEAGQFGWDYIESHPLNVADAEDLYRRVKQEALEAGLTCMWAPVADVDGQLTGQVQIKVTTSEDKLVGVVVASAQGVHARTAIERSGVWGVEAAVAALGAAISARAGAGR